MRRTEMSKGRQVVPTKSWASFPMEMIKVLQIAGDLGWQSRPMARVAARTLQSRLQKMCMAIRRGSPSQTPVDLRASAESVIWRLLDPEGRSLSPKALFALPQDYLVQVDGRALQWTEELAQIREDLEKAEGEAWTDSISTMSRAFEEDKRRQEEGKRGKFKDMP
jgi:hypothetical protein